MKRNFNYRHIVCVAVTLIFMACGIKFFLPALGRLLESGRDFGLSIAYYFCELCGIPYSFSPTVNNLPNLDMFPSVLIPNTWDGFRANWFKYWELFASADNVISYFAKLADILYVFAIVLLFALPVIFAVYFLFRRCLKAENNDYNKDSKPLKIWKGFTKRVYSPVKRFITELYCFIAERKYYYVTWLVIWLFYFNVITVGLEFLAFYFYFVFSFDFANIYRQVYKLFLDLATPFFSIPLFIWILLAVFIISRICKKRAYARLNRYELRNRGFINERPIVTMVVGTMGKKKTTAITDMALSQEVMFRDKAFEKILENDLKFPYFPWCNLENDIKRAMARHQVYSLATCRKFIKHLRFCIETVNGNHPQAKAVRRHLRRAFGYTYDNLLFDYDYANYGLTYDDKLKVVNLWDVLETYTQLYFIYIIQSSLICSNYSVRVDNILSDTGNFPLWNSDFFKRDSRLIDSFSRHSHILDFDSLRLGKKVLEHNPLADSFEFGVVVITEIGKERGNNLENLDKKKKDEEANQKNDFFNAFIKMVRHSATVDNYPFVKIITDEQRPSSWGADARDLCEIVHIKDSGERELALPFFSLFEFIYSLLFGKFTDLYYNYRYTRSDNTLTMHFFKSFAAKLYKFYTGVCNNYGYCTMKVQIESGTLDGKFDKNKYYLLFKKIYSKRFSTDCLSGFFTEKALRSPVGLNDILEYVTEKATFDELKRQNSYFINDVVKMSKQNNIS